MLSDVADGGHTSAITCGSVMGESTYMGLHNQVMTDQQMETLREQIRAYSVICSQLVEMHKDMSQQPCDPRLVTGQCMLYGLAAVTPGLKMSARQRWTPTQVQLEILESLFEQGNASPNKQKVKEITNQLSQYGQISETNVYNWFQNRKARAKKKQMLLPQKESESEIETDDESPRRKKAKIESSSNPENMGPGQSDANAEIVERNHGNQPQFEFQDNALESLLSSENVAEVKHRASFDRTRPDVIANAGHGFIQSLSEVKPVHLSNTVGSSEHGMNQTKFSGSPIEVSSTVTVLLDGKPWKVPSGAFDVTRMRGDDTVLLDFHGHTVPTNGTGGGSYSLHANKSYTVPRPSDIVKGTSVKKSEGLLIQSLHQVANPLNEV